MPLFFDTSIYLRILLDQDFAARAEPALRRFGPELHLSSVVRAELTQGARGAAGRALVDRLARTMERVGRVVTPLHGDWVRAASVQSEIWDASPSLRSKRMLNDLLIACSTRRIGAALVTANDRDFGLIDRWIRITRFPAEHLFATAAPRD